MRTIKEEDRCGSLFNILQGLYLPRFNSNHFKCSLKYLDPYKKETLAPVFGFLRNHMVLSLWDQISTFKKLGCTPEEGPSLRVETSVNR